MQTVTTEWTSGMSFDSHIGSHHVVMDAASQFGGKNRGPTPKPVVLSALGGCTGMDVVSLLRKMRVEIEGFRIIAQAETQEEHPKVYTSIHLIYEFTGKNLPLDKLKKAVDLSQERYCSVSAMLRKAASLSYEVKVVE